MKKQIGPQGIIIPTPAALVVSGTIEDTRINTIAWMSNLSGGPPTIGMSMGQNKHTLEFIRKYKNYTINIPSVSIMKEVDLCGIVSGKSYDKFDITKLTRLNSSKISSPIIEECPINIELRLINETLVNKTVLLFGEVIETHIDEDKLTEDLKPDISKIDPLVYCSKAREYWSLGNNLGPAYKIGKDLIGND
jgi:flavin reductase (DIM6/NTAB) family NADH-FMN oxidoreductase RutF